MAVKEASGVQKAPEQSDKVLAYAWELYETYSKGSQSQKKANSGIRQKVIWLIFWTSVLAVLSSLPGVRGLLALAASWLPERYDALGTWLVRSGGLLLSAVLIILSVTTSALLAFASQFTPLKAWIMYRVGADRIRSEVYLYRMGAGEYKQFPKGSAERRGRFLERIEGINREIYELETAPPFLQLMGKDEGSYDLSVPRIMWKRLVKPIGRLDRSGEVAAISQDDPTTKKRLSGRYYPEHDNGFNELSIESYIDYRVLPQRNWYVEKVYEDYEKIKDWRKVMLTIGGGSAVLAAVQLEPYIVITTAAAVAVNTHIQLNLIGSTYGNYHVTASRIDSELVRWRNLPDPERHSADTISQFVSNIESILEAERAIWMQQASQAQQESEQTLIKGAGRRREGEPSLLVQSDVVPPTSGDVVVPAPGASHETPAVDGETEQEKPVEGSSRATDTSDPSRKFTETK